MAKLRIEPSGLAMPWPAMSGALPWIGSYSAERLPSGRRGPSDAEGSMPSEPVTIAAQSERMSPNRFSVTITSNWRGIAHELHRAVVDVHVGELDIGELVGVHPHDDLAPERAELQHVRLVDRAHPVAPRAGERERVAGDAFDSAVV